MKEARIISLLARYFEKRSEVIAAYLFGSRAEGVARADSDADIAVLTDPLPPDSLKYRLEIMEETGRLIRLNTEIVLLNEAPTLLRFQVI